MTRRWKPIYTQQTRKSLESPYGLLKALRYGTDSWYHFQREV